MLQNHLIFFSFPRHSTFMLLFDLVIELYFLHSIFFLNLVALNYLKNLIIFQDDHMFFIS